MPADEPDVTQIVAALLSLSVVGDHDGVQTLLDPFSDEKKALIVHAALILALPITDKVLRTTMGEAGHGVHPELEAILHGSSDKVRTAVGLFSINALLAPMKAIMGETTLGKLLRVSVSPLIAKAHG